MAGSLPPAQIVAAVGAVGMAHEDFAAVGVRCGTRHALASMAHRVQCCAGIRGRGGDADRARVRCCSVRCCSALRHVAILATRRSNREAERAARTAAGMLMGTRPWEWALSGNGRKRDRARSPMGRPRCTFLIDTRPFIGRLTSAPVAVDAVPSIASACARSAPCPRRIPYRTVSDGALLPLRLWLVDDDTHALARPCALTHCPCAHTRASMRTHARTHAQSDTQSHAVTHTHTHARTHALRARA